MTRPYSNELSSNLKGKIMTSSSASKLLNVSEHASQSDIRKAYKIACLKFHPDRNPTGGEVMMAINEAYNFLKHKIK